MPEHGHGHGGNMTPEQQKAMIEQEMRLYEQMGKVKYKIEEKKKKGGVGKSTVAANLAEAFQKKGMVTGIMDVDIHGPNIPKLFGVEGKEVMIDNGKMVPVYSKNGIKVMSMGFLIETNDKPIIWRGPQKSGAIKQFMADVAWGDLDVLIIDNPPGTGDEPLTVLQTLPNVDAVVMVTTPNSISQEDVVKCVNMVKMLHIDKIGLVENMAYYVCPHCGEKSEIFGKSQGDEFASQMDIKFLDSLPLTEEVLKSTEDDSTVVDSYVQSELSEKFISIADKIEKEFL